MDICFLIIFHKVGISAKRKRHYPVLNEKLGNKKPEFSQLCPGIL
jgi:hypothetical protein